MRQTQLSTASLISCFPHEALRPFQADVLKGVEEAIFAKKRFIILEAPVGFGKSAIAVALAKYFGSAYILTSTKQLQEQYASAHSIPVTVGKNNFTCRIRTNAGTYPPCSQGRCEADWKLIECPHYLPMKQYDERLKRIEHNSTVLERFKRKLCPYYVSKFDALRASVMVANYPFFIAEARYTTDLKKRKLVVCDEAHDLERQLVTSAAFTFRRSTLHAFTEVDGSAVRKRDITVQDMGQENPSAWMPQIENAVKTFDTYLHAHLKDGLFQEKVVSCRNALESMKGFLDDLKMRPHNWVVNSVKSSVDTVGGASVDEVMFQSLDVSPYADVIFNKGETVMLMSATIFSKELFCRSLGIPVDQAAFISVKESSFPIENRKIHALNIAHLSRETMDASMAMIASEVDKIMTDHASERGIIHTTTYAQARYIMEHTSPVNRARLITTEKAGSVASLIRVHGMTQNSVLLSPSLNQGVDLKDDLARFAIICKIPYPDLSERRTRVKLKRDATWYAWQTALRIVQTYGRTVRSPEDHAVTYILDANFNKLMEKHPDMFPTYFKDAIQKQLM
nr:helicase C-terminal domain-containing protein [Ferrimicrobium acidiphilum]